MSFLTAAQQASALLISKKPPTFFSSTRPFEVEICAIANEFARDIVTEKDWRKLTVMKEMVGGTGTIQYNGAVEAFDLPADYARMPKGQKVHNKDWLTWNYCPATSLDEWMFYINGQPLPAPGAWILLDGQMQFNPVIEAGTTAQYYYISKNVVRDQGGNPQSQFLADSDTCVLDEQLLTLALIWRWRALKRLEYAEDLRNYELYKETCAGEDKGATILINGGRSLWAFNGGIAYPWSLGT